MDAMNAMDTMNAVAVNHSVLVSGSDDSSLAIQCIPHNKTDIKKTESKNSRIEEQQRVRLINGNGSFINSLCLLSIPNNNNKTDANNDDCKSKDSRLFVVGVSSDGKISIWCTSSGQCIGQVNAGHGILYDITYYGQQAIDDGMQSEEYSTTFDKQPIDNGLQIKEQSTSDEKQPIDRGTKDQQNQSKEQCNDGSVHVFLVAGSDGTVSKWALSEEALLSQEELFRESKETELFREIECVDLKGDRSLKSSGHVLGLACTGSLVACINQSGDINVMDGNDLSIRLNSIKVSKLTTNEQRMTKVMIY